MRNTELTFNNEPIKTDSNGIFVAYIHWGVGEINKKEFTLKYKNLKAIFYNNWRKYGLRSYNKDKTEVCCHVFELKK